VKGLLVRAFGEQPIRGIAHSRKGPFGEQPYHRIKLELELEPFPFTSTLV
jgi:hypothetical protein